MLFYETVYHSGRLTRTNPENAAAATTLLRFACKSLLSQWPGLWTLHNHTFASQPVQPALHELPASVQLGMRIAGDQVRLPSLQAWYRLGALWLGQLSSCLDLSSGL